MDIRSRLYLQVQVTYSLSVQGIDPQKGELGRLNVEIGLHIFYFCLDLPSNFTDANDIIIIIHPSPYLFGA